MNPQTNPSPNTPSPQQPASQAPLSPQVVEAIPLHQQGQPPVQPAAVNPIAQESASVVHSQSQDDDLEDILQSVNNKVQAGSQPVAKKSFLKSKNIAAKADKIKVTKRISSTWVVGALAVLVAIGLSAAAVFAYHESTISALSKKPATVGTSDQASDQIQQAGGTLVRPSDLDDYASTLQTKLNSLNDSQDFDTNSLSDQVLGL